MFSFFNQHNIALKMASAQLSDVDWQSTTKTVSERNRHMFNNSELSDISFTCEGSDKTFYAHKYVLATSSAVFKAMFYGDLAEQNSVVHLSDTDEKSLEEFLRFLYTDKCNLTTDNVVSVMYLSKKYIVPALTEYVKAQLVRNVEPDNVLSVLEQAIHFGEKDLETKCWQVIEWRASEVASSLNFINIKQTTLAGLLKRNNLIISELELFQAVLKWINNQCSQQSLDLTTENRRSVIGEAVYDLRLLALSEQPFAEHVSTSGLLTDDELVVIYEKFNGIDSPSLKWILPERKQTLNTTAQTRISRFPNSRDSVVSGSGYIGDIGWEYNEQSTDTLSFSVDQFVLFLGVRLFGYSSEYYSVDLTVNNEKLIRGRYRAENTYAGIKGFDVMFKPPMLVKENDVVKMEATISGRASSYGWRGEPKVTVEGLTVTFIDSCFEKRTCVSQGQFHQLILSV